MLIAGYSLFVGPLVGFALNPFTSIASAVNRLYSAGFESMFLEAAKSGSTLVLSLISGQVFGGLVCAINTDSRRGVGTITIVPMFAGRLTDRGRFAITTYYGDLWNKDDPTQNPPPKLVIRFDAVQTAAPYDPRLHVPRRRPRDSDLLIS